MLIKFLISVFVAAHGLVHLWYVVLSQKLVPFEQKMGWTGESWLLSGLFNTSIASTIATVLYAVSALLFIAAAAAFYAQVSHWENIMYLAVIVSSVTIIMFWDGMVQMLVEKGIIGLLINFAILLLLFKYA